MGNKNLRVLRFFALLMLLPGIAGLVASAVVSTNYLLNLPRFPAVEEQRMIPRNIDGVVIYQTQEEDDRLTVMEYSSVSIFAVGMVLGIVYLEKWSSRRQLEIEGLEESEA